MNTKLSVKNLYKIFGQHPDKALKLLDAGKDKDEIFDETGQAVGVQNASFDIKEGEIFVIMGLSGSGKSTIVRMLNRLIEPTQGQVLLDGVDIAKMNDEELRQIRLHKISMVFQSFALMPHLTVRENVSFGLGLAAEIEHAEQVKRADEALERVGLLANGDSFPSELSGGMQQRVGLARALCINPDVLLMDEAFSALDPLIRSEMQDELLRLQAEDRRTIVFISHDLDEAVRIGDRIAIMQDGVVVQVGTPDDIINSPANDYVRSFFRGVDISTVLSAKDLAQTQQPIIIQKQSTQCLNAALQQLQGADEHYGYVVDEQHQFVGVVSTDSIESAQQSNLLMGDAYLSSPDKILFDTPVSQLISAVAHAPCAPPVVDDSGKLIGVISKTLLLDALDRQETQNESR